MNHSQSFRRLLAAGIAVGALAGGSHAFAAAAAAAVTASTANGPAAPATTRPA